MEEGKEKEMEEEINQIPTPQYHEPKAMSFFTRQRTWLNVLLFVITVVCCFFVGLTWSINYVYADDIVNGSFGSIGLADFMNPDVIVLSVWYAVVLIAILLAHEMGHYLTCRFYGINATLPYFIPFPPPSPIGTMGAFIKIRSPITRKQQLFDVGVAGPLAGFVLALPALVYGLSLSKAVPHIPEEGSIIFGEPLLFKILSDSMFRGAPENFDLILHPVAFAGWVGALVTALNLFPIGQLDGGHVVYALFGKRSKKFARPVFVAFIVMGVFFWIGWFVWAILIRFIGLKHPRIWDEEVPISLGRRWIAVLVVLIFIFSFIPDPIKGGSLLDMVMGSGVLGR
jgi:Zn-dependent protease